MTSSRQNLANMPVDQQERQISASYFISSNNRSFIRNRHFAVYEPMSQRLPAPVEQPQPEPEGHFQDEQGNAISPLAGGHSGRFFESDNDSDDSEAIIGNSTYISHHSNMESSHSTDPQQTPHGPQHHLIVASSPSFESDGSTFAHTDDGKENLFLIDETKHLDKLPSPNNNNRSRIVSPIRSNYLKELQAEINSLQQDVLGMQESILLLARDMKKARVARIRNKMIAKYGHGHTDTSVSSETTAVSGLDNIDALIAECLNSIHEAEESESQSKTEASMSYSSEQVIKSVERKSAIHNRFQQRRGERQREEQSPSHSMKPITTPRRHDQTITPLESIQTPSPFHKHDDGHEHLKRNLFLAGHTPGVKLKRKDREEAMTIDDRIHRTLLVLFFLAAAAVVLMPDARVKSNGTSLRRPRRSRLSTKKLTIDLQLNSCGKCEQASIPHYDPDLPHFVQELGVWRSYREGRARLEPWRAIVLSLRGRSSLDPLEGNDIVSEYTFWL